MATLSVSVLTWTASMEKDRSVTGRNRIVAPSDSNSYSNALNADLPHKILDG